MSQRRLPHARGVAIVELALSATLLLTMLLGIIEVGRALTEYKVLVNQVETAARYLSTRPAGTGSSEATCLVRTGVISCGASTPTVLRGLSSATVKITDSQSSDGGALLRVRTSAINSDLLGVRVNLVTVGVSGYRFNVLGGGFGTGSFGGMTSVMFPTISSTQRQFAG